ncbi:MAG: DUF4292 domain-containing protein [Bacteroidales bacterium]|nr:DUF4292 domain-containing protein [Bacteroidales bacterium]
MEIDGESISLSVLYDSLAASYQPWQDVYMPVNLALKSPTSFSISGRATMVRDQSIHMSLRMFGMEVAIVHIEGDSIYAIDKYHKKYVAESISRLLAGYPMSVSDIQDLFLGQAFVPGQGTIDEKSPLDFSFAPEAPAQWVMAPQKKRKGVEWWATATEALPPVLNSISFVVTNKGQVDCLYSNPYSTPAGIVNSLLDLAATTSSLGANAQIKWTIKDAKWNTGRTAPLTPPSSSYQRIDAMALLSSLKL